MWCNQIFSIMSKQDDIYKIENVIVCDNFTIANDIAKNAFGENAISLETTLFPVSVGDTYDGAYFYDKSGNRIKENKTETEQIAELKEQLIEAQNAIKILTEKITE